MERFFVSKYESIQLERAITEDMTLEKFEKLFPPEFLDDDRHVGNWLEGLLNDYNKKASVVSEEAGLATSYVGHIINGRKRNPSRDALIAICLAIGTNLKEVQDLLKYAGQAPLYVRRRRDVVIWFGFMKKMSLDEVDENLTKRGYRPLVKV